MSNEQSNTAPRPNAFNVTRHNAKKPKINWTHVMRAINAVKTK